MTIEFNDITANASGLIKAGQPGGDSGLNKAMPVRTSEPFFPFIAWIVSRGNLALHNIYNYLYKIMCLLCGSNNTLTTRYLSIDYITIASFLRNEYRVFYDSKGTIASFLRHNSEFFTIFREKRVFYDFASISLDFPAFHTRVAAFLADFTLC